MSCSESWPLKPRQRLALSRSRILQCWRWWSSEKPRVPVVTGGRLISIASRLVGSGDKFEIRRMGLKWFPSGTDM